MASVSPRASAEAKKAADSSDSIDEVDEYEDAEQNYQPKSLKFWTILIGMYLAMFLVALVGTSFGARAIALANNGAGPNNHRDPHCRNHERVQLN